MNTSEASSEIINVEKIVTSIRGEVVRDLLKTTRFLEVPAIMADVPIPDLSNRSKLYRFFFKVPPFKQMVTLFLRMGRLLFFHYNANNRISMNLMVEELERQNRVIRHLLHKSANNDSFTH